MGWLYLALAGVFEVGFTTSLRFSNNFKNLLASIAFLICVALSLLFLELATARFRSVLLTPSGLGLAQSARFLSVWSGFASRPRRSVAC